LPDFADRLEALLKAERVPPRALIVEVTERAMMQAPALVTLHRLRALGLAIAIDDFGTGYSTLAYLRQLPVDSVKIDRTFVDHVGDDERATAFFRSVVGLAHTLDMTVIAEGVERESEWQVLEAAGCDLAQGFLIAHPLSPAEAEALIETAR
jgi:EAL domain-containing protein (putative c-di-GMP-specific phosphodiesterase class I)